MPDPGTAAPGDVRSAVRHVSGRGGERLALRIHRRRHPGDQAPGVVLVHGALPLLVDHLGSPPAEGAALAGWRRALSRLGTHPSVAAKVSGLFTLGPRQRPAAPNVRAVVEHAVETFGADRLMVGSDWPVSTGAGPYAEVWRETVLAVRGLSSAETAAVLGGTARELYLARSATRRPGPGRR